jgi:hypothetical protein
VKFAEASEVSEVVRSEVFEVLLTEVGEVGEVRRRTGAVSLQLLPPTEKTSSSASVIVVMPSVSGEKVVSMPCVSGDMVVS